MSPYVWKNFWSENNTLIPRIYAEIIAQMYAEKYF